MRNYFLNTIKEQKNVLTEGAIVERLKGEYHFKLDPFLMHAGFIYDKKKRAALKTIYQQYFDIAYKYNLPIMTTTPSRRANIERINKSQYKDQDINGDCFQFIDDIRKQYPNEMQKNIFIGGLMGCKNDAYKAEQALSTNEAYEFCKYQVERFVDSGVDFILAAVLPALVEAKGIAKRLSEYNTPYILSFVIRDTGKLLDGTTLHNAITQIDASVEHAPLFYNVNCVHTDVLLQALNKDFNKTKTVESRLLGIQANASRQTPEELESGAEIVLDTVDNIVKQMMELNIKHDIRVLGGCCGTNEKHIGELARQLNELRVKN